MARIAAAALFLALGACFSTPGFCQNDAGTDGPGDASDGGDGEIDAPPECVPAMEPMLPQLVPLDITQVSAGYHHACAIDTASRMWCWGSNEHGQLGDRTDSPGVATGTPGLASAMTGWTSVSASSRHSCGVAGGKVYCWGSNADRQANPQSIGDPILPTEVVLPSLGAGEVASKVFAGPTASCAITTMNRAACWGDTDLAAGNFAPDVRYLVATNGMSFWSTIALVEDHACAISVNGHIFCWGDNALLQLGVDSSTASRTFLQTAPRVIDELFDSIAVARSATCATRTDGALVCFGSNSRGHLGSSGASTDEDHLVAAGPMNRVATGFDHVCATTVANTVRCYGDNADGALGGGSYAPNRALGSALLSNVTAVVAGESFSCALNSANRLSCWGNNTHGELGLGDVARKRQPSQSLLPIGSCESVQQVVSGDRHTCALVVEAASMPGRAYCWGNNADRQVTGVASTEIAMPRPHEPYPQEKFVRLAAGERHTCGLRDDGSIRCWGDNSSRQLGAAGAASVVVPPSGGMPWTYVAAGSRATCAVRASGDLYCWGDVPAAQSQMPPTSFSRPANQFWSTVALGSGFGLGTATDPTTPNRVYIYGFAPNGCQLDGAPTSHPPDDPYELYNTEHVRANVAAAQANGGHLCFHINDVDLTNKVTCVGDNTSYQCGPNQPQSCVGYEDPPTPPTGWRTAFPGVSTVTASRTHTCALDSTGQPWCWGTNNTAELGALPFENQQPAMVTAQAFAEISTGADHTCGIVENRSGVMCWGENRHGQVGDNARFHAAPTPAALVPP